MLFLRWFLKIPQTRYKPRSAAEKSLRTLLILLFVAGLIAAFWANSDRYVQVHKSQSRLSDEAGLLDEEHRKKAVSLLTEAEVKYGAKIYIKVSLLPITSTDATPGGVFLGLCPNIRQTVLLMPDSWRSYLGESFVIRLKDEVMHAAYAQNAWQDGMLRVLELVNARFAEVVNAVPPAEQADVAGREPDQPAGPAKPAGPDEPAE